MHFSKVLAVGLLILVSSAEGAWNSPELHGGAAVLHPELVSGQGENPSWELPSNYRLHEHIISFPTSKFTLQDENGYGNYGTITEKFFSLAPAFYFHDAQGNLIASARSRIFALGSTCDVFDANGKKIATIKEKILKSLFKAYTQYSILDGEGNEIATSDKVELFATHFKLRDETGRVVAEMKRPFFNLLSDNWYVSSEGDSAVDPRVIALIPAFKTIADNTRKSQHAFQSYQQSHSH